MGNNELKEKNTHKNQHFIPASYLKLWVDPEFSTRKSGFIWLYARDGSFVRKISPQNVFKERDFYTIVDKKGKRDLYLEEKLSVIEGLYASLQKNKLCRMQSLDENEKQIIVVFVATLLARTAKKRQMARDNWGKLIENDDKWVEWQKTMSPKELKQKAKDDKRILDSLKKIGAPSISLEEAKKIYEHPIQEMMGIEVEITSKLLSNMNFTFFYTKHPRGFITSDSPVLLIDPELGKNGFSSLAFNSPTIEILCPLSPQLSIVFSHYGPNGYFQIEGLKMEEVNRLYRANADKYFVVNKNTIEPFWLSKFTDAQLINRKYFK